MFDFNFFSFTTTSTYENENDSENIHVPLDSVPEEVVEQYPQLELSPYFLTDGKRQTCTNVAALLHNACRVEMMDMYYTLLPALRVPSSTITNTDAQKLCSWWRGFARFILTTSVADEHLLNTALGDIVPDYDPDAVAIGRAARRTRARNTINLECAVRTMGKGVEQTRATLQTDSLETAWDALVQTLCAVYDDVHNVLRLVDEWRRNDHAIHPNLERTVAALYATKAAWGPQHRAESVVILTRWMASEPLMKVWMQKNLTKYQFSSADQWLHDFRVSRLDLVQHFYDKLTV